MAHTQVTVDLELLRKFVAFMDAELDGDAITPDEDTPKGKAKAPAAKKAAAKVEPDVEDDDDDDDSEDAVDRDAREAELKKTNIRTLRKIAIAAGFDADEVNDAEKDDLVDSILDDEFEGDDDDDDADANEDDDDAADEAEDDDAEEGEYLDRKTLEGMNLRELKAVAKGAPYFFDADDLKGQDQSTIIEELLEEGGDDSDDDAADDGEDGEDGEFLTEDDLKAMTLKELKATAKEYGVTFPAGVKAPALIALILEDEDED